MTSFLMWFALMWFALMWIVCGIINPFLYIIVEYKGTGKKVFDSYDFFIMALLALIGPIGVITAIKISFDYGIPELDISKWIDK